MSRYIDADALKEENKTIIDCEIEHPKYQNTVREIIDSAPTIEIVRCKECIFADLDAKAEMYKCLICSFPWWNKGEHFCSYGEREGE